MVYLNNGATSYPKPKQVLEEGCSALGGLLPGQERGGGSGSAHQADDCRKSLASLLSIRDTEQIFFCSGATDAANFLLRGLNLAGRRIVTTATEHNCVLRPLYNLEELKECEIIILPCDRYGRIDPDRLASEVDGNTAAVLVNHCCNVTGTVQNLEAIGRRLKHKSCLFIADVSQSAGCLPIQADEWGLDALFFTGHKSLFGAQGTGGFFIRKGIPLKPLRFGGTGKAGLTIRYQSGTAPHECGTLNQPGLRMLNAGVRFIAEKGLDSIQSHEAFLMNRIKSALSDLSRIRIYDSGEGETGPLFSLCMEGLDPSDLEYILYNSYGIITRSGFQCCPLIHEYLNTKDTGTLRISLSCMNCSDDVDVLVKALIEIHKSLEVVQ